MNNSKNLEVGRQSTQETSIVEWNSFFNPKFAFLVFQWASAWVSVVVAFQGIDRDLNTWNRYQDFYGFLVNSSVMNYLFSVLSYALVNLKGEEKSKPKSNNNEVSCDECVGTVIGWILLFPVAVLLPCFFTHIFPGYALYVWVYGLYFAAWGLLYFLVSIGFECAGYDSRYLEGFLQGEHGELGKQIGLVAWKVFARLFFLLFMQSGFNYSYLYYDALHGVAAGKIMTHKTYVNVVVEEFVLRSQTLCSFEHFADSVENIVVFFSWV